MEYFKNTNNQVFAYDKEQIQKGWGKDLTPITEVEKNEILAPLPKEVEKERILSIKAKAGEIIKSKYSIEWQLNHPRLDETYVNEYAWIDNIRKISNEAEANGTALEDIDWGI